MVRIDRESRNAGRSLQRNIRKLIIKTTVKIGGAAMAPP